MTSTNGGREIEDDARRKMQVLRAAYPIYAEQIRKVAESQRILLAKIDPLIQARSSIKRIFEQFDMSRRLFADVAWERLNFPVHSLSIDLLKQMTLPSHKLIQESLRLSLPSRQLIELQAIIGRQMDEWQRTINDLIRPQLEPLIELAHRAGRVPLVAEAFRRNGLWLAPSMPEELVDKIVRSFKNGTPKRTVSSIVSKYYARDNWKLLEEAVTAWEQNPFFTQHMRAIRDALDAHGRGQYTLTIPTLIGISEGICADYVKKKNLMPKLSSKTREIMLSALQDMPYGIGAMTQYAGVYCLEQYVENQMYAWVDFDKQHRKLRREKRLVGHAIRHGRQSAYDTRMNSLRLFLLIDVLSLLR